MTALDFIDKAIAIAQDRYRRIPAFEVYTSVLNQLYFIKAILEKRETDKARLHDLTLGAIAVKEFEETDPELCEALKDAFYIADQIARGLKVQLP
ncbi:immunity protein Tsi6 family protein [Pseudomonas silvicola]|uniref:immunity protein Tsi6 family protein n=1 Tax=Pseudomonas sp. RIT-To-2 TaxID=3462541 RepID=UPI00227C4FDB|nr:immunity protein Tsi6 family protein [Pseudomonas silvicola]